MIEAVARWLSSQDPSSAAVPFRKAYRVERPQIRTSRAAKPTRRQWLFAVMDSRMGFHVGGRGLRHVSHVRRLGPPRIRSIMPARAAEFRQLRAYESLALYILYAARQ